MSWSSWREAALVIACPKHVKRTITLALSVGTVFFAMNQLPLVLAGHATAALWVKAALTYLTPLFVSNIGILTATRRASEMTSSRQTPRKSKKMRLRRMLTCS
jgi:hypothetical protein